MSIMSTEKNFEWNDATVKEMIYSKLPIPEHYCGDLQKCLDEFKQSKNNEPDKKLFYFEVVAVSDNDKSLGYEVSVGNMQYKTAWDSNGEPKLTTGKFIEEVDTDLKRHIVFPTPTTDIKSNLEKIKT